MARPSKLTPAVHERFITAIQVGATMDVAADHAGISKDTAYEWDKKGEKAIALAFDRLRRLQTTGSTRKGTRRKGVRTIPPNAELEPWLLLTESPEERELQAYARFSDALKKALNEWELRALAKIVGAKDWQASAWLLERRKAEVYGRRRIEVTGPGGGPVQASVVVNIPHNGRR